VRSDGFAIFVCTCDSRALRDELITNLSASMPTPVHRLDVVGEDPLNEIVESVPDDGGSVMLVGLEAPLGQPDRTARLVERLNLRREQWPEQIRRPVVFWVTGRLLGHLTNGAPDFFDWRSDTIDFPDTVVPAAVLGDRRWEYGVDPRLSSEERGERRKELESRIRVAEGASDPRVLSNLATWWDELAEILLVQGQLEEALRIRREEQLPVYERLGDVRGRAVALYKIASVSLGRDDLSPEERRKAIEALSESFAIFRRLDEPQGIAFVGLALARMRFAKGGRDDALEILAAVASAFERLGDADRLADVEALKQEIERNA